MALSMTRQAVALAEWLKQLTTCAKLPLASTLRSLSTWPSDDAYAPLEIQACTAVFIIASMAESVNRNLRAMEPNPTVHLIKATLPGSNSRA